MKKIMLVILLVIGAKAELVYQGANPLTIGSYNVTTQSAIPLTFKNTGAAISSLSGGIIGANAADFKISLNRCNNVLVNKSCQVSIAAISKTISIGEKSISVGGANLNITVVKLDSNGQVIVPPSSTENLDITPNSLADLQFVPGEKYKTVSLSVKNTGSVAVIPSFSWSSNSANVSFLLNRCSVSLNPNKSCAISLKVLAPLAGSEFSQSFQASSSSQLRDSLSFVIKGVVGGSNLSCNYNSQTYAHGASVPGFSAATVAFGSLCSSVAVNGTCNNGVISNQPSFPSCSVSSPATCEYNLLTYNHGDSIPGFGAASVAFGQLCSSVSVSGSCNNGTIDNQPSFPSCSVDPLVCPSNQHLSLDETQCINNFQAGYKLLHDYSSSETITASECHSQIDAGGEIPGGLDFYLRMSSDSWDNGTAINDSGFCGEYVGFIPMFAPGTGFVFTQDKGSYVDCSGGGLSLLVSKGGYNGDLNTFCQNLDLFSPMGYSSNIQSFENTVQRTSANPYNIKPIGNDLFYIISTKINQNQPGFLAKISLLYDDQPIVQSLVNTNYIVKNFEVINNKIVFIGYHTSDLYNYKFYEYIPTTGQINLLVLDGTCSAADAFNFSNNQLQVSLSCSPNRKFYISNDGSNFTEIGQSNQPIFWFPNYESSNNTFFAINGLGLYSINNNVVEQVINGASNHLLFKQSEKLFLIVRDGTAYSLKKYNTSNSSWDNVYTFPEPQTSTIIFFKGNVFSYMVFERLDGALNKVFYKTYLINSSTETIDNIDSYTYNKNCTNENLTSPFLFGFVNELNDNLISLQCDNNVVETFAIAPNTGSGNKTIISSTITPYLRDLYNSQNSNSTYEIKDRKDNQIIYKNKTYLKARDSSLKTRIARIDSSNNLELLPDLCSSSPSLGFTNGVTYVDDNWGSGGFSIYKDNLIFAGNSCQGEVLSNTNGLELFKYFEE